MNCWEYINCGREVGGANVDEMGICPAALPCELEGTNNGSFGGRICWAVAGTLCDGAASHNSARKLSTCLECDFLNQVHLEESRGFVLTPLHAVQFSSKGI
jgi:hypothetical protein